MATNVVPINRRSEQRRRAVLDRRASILEKRNQSFLRLASHELRTPLNSVIGFAEILAGELCGPLGAPQYKDYAEHVRLSGHKLLRLVNQVLEIVRLEGAGADLRITSEPLDHAIDDVLDTLAEELRLKSISVEVMDRGALPSVMADARGLRTVLANLVQNAVIATPEGGEVRIATLVGGGCVELTIVDEGEGIDPGQVPRLMRPFEQGENPLTRSRDGSGLGLPIARLLCRNMGGSLRLDCEQGRGVEAVVRLPVG